MTLQELLVEQTKEKKSNKKDKTAKRYFHYVAGNMLFNQPCSGDLSGTKKVKK
jgi:hypothetical protein